MIASVPPAPEAGVTRPRHRPVVLDDEDVDAALVGDEGALRYHHLLFRRAGLERDLDELAVAQSVGRIWHRGTHQHRVP